MPFKTKTVREQRLELVRLAMQPATNISLLCRRFGVSRRICYKWVSRFKALGAEGLTNQSRRPHASPRQTPPAVEENILAHRTANPQWGARKIKALLKREHPEQQAPAPSTITVILHRHHLITAQQSEAHQPFQRFAYSRPNELWQMDFKGQFSLLDDSLCYALTITDDHSRFNLCLQACANEQYFTVKEQLTRVFRRYGLPDRILSDNGAPWGTEGHPTQTGETPLSQLAVWLMRLQVQLIHGRPYHPQTQGKEERFHQTLKRELLQYEQFRNLAHCQQRFDWWRDKYNLQRPHEAIGQKTPAELYSPSAKSFPQTLPPIEYAPTDEVRKVNQNGCISYQHQTFKIGKGLIEQLVAIRATADQHVKEIYFCKQKIKNITLTT